MASTDATVEYGSCPECGYRTLPILPMLPCGHKGEATRTPLDSAGTVYSWSRVETGSGAIVIAMVDFFMGQLRVTSPMQTDADVEIGDEVHITRGVDTPYAFVPATSSG